YVLLYGHVMLGVAKPFPFESYAMPAFFGDGYGVIRDLIRGHTMTQIEATPLLILLGSLCILKIMATAVSLGSGGSGGIIAPSLFVGATAGGFVGLTLHQLGWFGVDDPSLHALIGMGAVLGAVVHAPLAAILILVE